VNVTVRFRTEKLRHSLFKTAVELDRVAATAPERAAQHAVEEAKATTLFGGTGRTKSTFIAKQKSVYGWRASFRGASLWLNRGTGIYGPHKTPVVPVHATFLRWVGAGGKVFFRRSVRGIKPTHFADIAREKAEIRFRETLRLEVAAALAAHNR
jgi:hypothetical protein